MSHASLVLVKGWAFPFFRLMLFVRLCACLQSQPGPAQGPQVVMPPFPTNQCAVFKMGHLGIARPKGGALPATCRADRLTKLP